MKHCILFILSAILIGSSCSKDESLPHKDTLETRTSGPDVCGSVTKIKLIPKIESNGTTTVTTDYSIKNCTNIVPVSIYLDITNRITNQQVQLFSNLPFASKIPWAGLKSGHYYSFTVFVIRNDTGEVIDAQAQFISIP